MYLLKTEHSFDAAHFLAGYEGKCSNIHGHRWRVVVGIESETLQEDGQCSGMVVDFSQLKKDIKNAIDYFDHSLIVEKNSMKEKTMDALEEEHFRIIQVDFRPTAENLAKYFYDLFAEKGYCVRCVDVYETPNNCASYASC
ncbi:6-carboxytetrahydropterin synthase QueD [Anaerobium acetethylicum]|uniref:6-carboxy-5,6,7,8-tetrahydropterin synthase n=1 Tax=Anaerobium acetethylicum TaxID=1619234 RepID=A0A1D3TN84_9FIRM|nr:6-carboxytetrahydropterin synthase QueD [Anaerobium acetethylicum]SCP94742.1 6-pyruvoyltetrahydropterin/6-carboxytetrahydropterin synthase [Anaerobium acetethylicum]